MIRKCLAFILNFSLVASCSGGEQKPIASKGESMSSWFSDAKYVRLEISRGKLGDRSSAVLFTTTNSVSVEHFQMRISGLSSEGDMMKKFSPDAIRITLKFTPEGSDEATEIQVIDRKFKRSGGGFPSVVTLEEQSLVQDLYTFLDKDLGTPVLKIPGAAVEGKVMKITFVGNVFKKNDEPGMPTIGPTNEDHFEILDKAAGTMELVKVYSGQTPPQPKKVSVAKRSYTIYTFLDSKKNRLPENYFEVSEN